MRIAVLIPCFNEAATVGKVVADFRAALPGVKIFVYDNNSSDDTSAVARAAGASVRFEPNQGKGHVVRRMLADVDADIYVLVDGDDTYDATVAPQMIDHLLERGLDLVTGTRAAESTDAYRTGHAFGNRLLTGLVTRLFGRATKDVLSGYRIFSNRFAKSFPVLTGGFEIETEMTVHALELGMPIADFETRYKERPEGSTSKLNTYRDGFRILRTIFTLIREERPLRFFSILATVLFAGGLGLAVPLLITYLETGLVPRIPTAILVTGLVLLGWLFIGVGLILDTVTRGRQEQKRLRYLQLESLDSIRRRTRDA